jgi:DNA-binding IclR family transcriptional regulator
LMSNTTYQTLSRGLQMLETLAKSEAPLSIDELGSALQVHRSIAYRLYRTLDAHRYVTRESTGKIVLAPRIATLAAGIASDLRTAVLPELTSAANDLGMTCFLVVLDGNECITLESIEPRHPSANLVGRPDTRHPMTVGAPGKAILVQLPPETWAKQASAQLLDEVTLTCQRGYACSHDEVLPTVQSVAVPLSLPGHQPAALAVVHIGTLDEQTVAQRIEQSANRIRSTFGE